MRSALLLAGIAAAAFAVRGFVAVPRAVPSASMRPALEPGDYVLVTRWDYRRRLPARGDVVVFRAPDGGDYVKRVIGLPGDRVASTGGALSIAGRPLPRFRIADYIAPGGIAHVPRYRELAGDRRWSVLDGGRTARDDFQAVTVPSGHLFLLGDNRDDSLDSRFAATEGGIGMVPAAALVGRVRRVVFATDGRATLWNPLSWTRAARPERIGAAP